MKFVDSFRQQLQVMPGDRQFILFISDVPSPEDNANKHSLGSLRTCIDVQDAYYVHLARYSIMHMWTTILMVC